MACRSRDRMKALLLLHSATSLSTHRSIHVLLSYYSWKIKYQHRNTGYCTQETHQEQLNLEGLKHSLTQSIYQYGQTNAISFCLKELAMQIRRRRIYLDIVFGLLDKCTSWLSYTWSWIWIYFNEFLYTPRTTAKKISSSSRNFPGSWFRSFRTVSTILPFPIPGSTFGERAREIGCNPRRRWDTRK